VFHPTYYDPYFLRYLKGKPFVLTVHDMIYELFPEYFTEDKYTVQNKRILISSASRINVISESTKKDLLRLFPEVENKITVVYHGCSFPVLDGITEKEDYILFTGARSGYKNFSNFIQALAPLLVSYNLKLVCTGHPFNTEEKEMLENLNIADKTICKYVSDKELIDLYAKALAFVFPSLYEGFGFPVLEAFAAGAPAVLANTSSLPEIGANAAVYFDPYSIDDMRNKIECVITSPDIQRDLMKKGKTRVKQFSWEKCASETLAVYQKLV
jgi:glycosyltransferase involved in cell wall biosynthesis